VELDRVDAEPARRRRSARPLWDAMAPPLGEIEELQSVRIETRH
jgi:hypothetical protein